MDRLLLMSLFEFAELEGELIATWYVLLRLFHAIPYHLGNYYNTSDSVVVKL